MSLKGSAVTVKKGTTSGGVLIAAMRAVSFNINSEIVDVTSADEVNRWRALLAATGVKSMSITLSGVLKDVTSAGLMITDCIAQTLDAYGLTVSTLGTFDGNFQIASFEANGEYNGIAQYTMTLESGGDITYAAVV